jgi:glutathione S-transferase
MFMAEKGIKMDTVEVDLMAGENREDAHMKRNPSGQMPALELDDGSFISEISVICEYLEEKNPGNPLFGSTPEERAETRMWTRKIDLNICEPLGTGFRAGEGFPLFKDRIPVFEETSAPMKKIAAHNLAWLDGQLAGKAFVCGDRFSYADIHLFCWVTFAGGVGQPLNPDLKNIAALIERLGSRESAAA